jgi:predicted nucleotidyltransferase
VSSDDGDARGRRTLEVAGEIAGLIEHVGARHALIGAGALAVHGYPRATRDLDLATEQDLVTQLRAVENACRERGWQTELSLPDAQDPLGGVLTVHGEGFDPVQVINFYNPFTDAKTPATEAIAGAESLEGTRLRVVKLEHLIALKLYAGGLKSRADVAALLEANPDADLTRIREVCADYELEEAFDAIIGA